MPAASKKCQCHFWRPMIIATEKLGCSNLKKYRFKCAIALIYAGLSEKISRGVFLLESGCTRVKSGDPQTSRHPTNIHFVRKKYGPSLLKHIVSKDIRRGCRATVSKTQQAEDIDAICA